jgi:hypothetical protein
MVNIYVSHIYPTLKYCVGGPMTIVIDRKAQLFLNEEKFCWTVQ